MDAISPDDGHVAISVVIPTWNRGSRAAKVVARLVAQAERDDAAASAEVLVVDDGSRTRERRLVAHAMVGRPSSLVRLICLAEHRGAAHARNTGFAASRGGVVAFLDDDLEPAPDYLRATLHAHRNHPDALVINGDIATERHDIYARFWSQRYDAAFNTTSDSFARIEALSSGNVSVKRRIADKIWPLFDPNLTSREDRDLFLRLAAAGIPVFKSNAIQTFNDPRRSLCGLLRQFAWYGRGEYELRRKYPGELLDRAGGPGHLPSGSSWPAPAADLAFAVGFRLEAFRRERSIRALVRPGDLRRLLGLAGRLVSGLEQEARTP